jgi:TPR repeat protein
MRAEQGHPEAEYNLGIAYIGGIGYPYDPVKASNYFEKAANKGVKEAAYNLGLIYENGLLGKPQPDEALMWYKDAAEKGSPEAKAALEHLAQSLGITLSEVNRIVDAVRATKYKKSSDEESSSSGDKAVSEPVALTSPKQGAVDSQTDGAEKNHRRDSGRVNEARPLPRPGRWRDRPRHNRCHPHLPDRLQYGYH